MVLRSNYPNRRPNTLSYLKFLSPFEGILNLQHNIPPLTHFAQNNKVQQTYSHYDRLLLQLKQHLRTEKLQILSADKGPGLILIPTKELTELYREHLQQNATTATMQQYNETLRRLKVILYLMKVNIPPQAATDDRPPTCYFKVKTHKAAFRNYTTAEPHIHIYTLGGKALANLSRPIINHKNSITTHCSNVLQKLITPIINNSPLLTKDVHHTISRLCTHGPPTNIYTGDIEKFYPNTPHSLVIEAMAYYHPRATGERHILRRLLEYNYTTDGNQLFHLGNVGIPMGLPLAPELDRMCTAYLLRDYKTPPGHSLTIYFDDVATYPIDNLPLEPYNLKPTPPNTTQDCLYLPSSNKFVPVQQEFRQPVLLHPQSYHPSKKMAGNTYITSVFRATEPQQIQQTASTSYCGSISQALYETGIMQSRRQHKSPTIHTSPQEHPNKNGNSNPS